MAFFNNKEFEALQAENEKLKDKIALLEVRLSAKNKAIVEMRSQIDEMKTQNEEYTAAIDKLKIAASNKISFHEVEKIRQEYLSKISALENRLSATQIRPHNERNAGRKRKAKPEQALQILSLHADGLSHVKIAKILTEQSGDKWNKSTVRNIIIAGKS